MKLPSLLALLAACSLVTPATAQYAPPSTGGAAALDYLLQRLSEHRRVLVIGAHPDDEDTGLLAVVARGYGAEAAYLALSRGEGGQNLIGDELGTALGLVRSKELVAARAVDGARQFFTRAYDFGFSRSLDEASRFWPPDSLLKDAVRVVRRFRPHVIVSVFSGTPRDGHGQHQAAGATARRVFDAAGDSATFPELEAEEGLTPWTPLKLYQSTRFDSTATTARLATGAVEGRSGRSFHQIAMASRSQHRSQDMGRLQTIGPAWSRIALLEDRTGSRPTNGEAQDHLFDGIAPDTGWLARLADSVRQSVSPSRLAEAAVPLASAAARSAPMSDTTRLGWLHEALAVAAGIVIDARVDDDELIPGEPVVVELEVYNAGPYEVDVDSVAILAARSWPSVPASAVGTVRPGERRQLDLSFTVPATAQPTQPYYLERPAAGALYDWSESAPEVRGLPFDPPVLQARTTIHVLGAGIVLQRDVTARYLDQAVGEIRKPLRVLPAIDVHLSPERLVWPADGRPDQQFTVTLTHHGTRPSAGAVILEADGWRVPDPVPFSLGARGESRAVEFRLARPIGLARGDVQVRALARTDDGRTFTDGVRLVEYPHISAVQWVQPATAHVTVAPIRLPRVRRVGYVRGAADRVPEALQQLGLPLTLLSAADLAAGDLSQFDAIVVGSRAYETDTALTRHNARLLEYVRAGGRLLVQYQQYQFVRGDFAPYPLSISRPHDRVTDETAAVTLLDPEHAAFAIPNRIGPDDWQDWPQERGLYFAGSWDEAYTPLLEMADPGADPLRGALLVARYGAGTYVYTGLSFFRALPAGVPGAFRLFLNLLALEPGSVP